MEKRVDSLSIFQSVLYKADTYLSLQEQPGLVIYNHATHSIVPYPEDSLLRLEPGCIYSIHNQEKLEKDVFVPQHGIAKLFLDQRQRKESTSLPLLTEDDPSKRESKESKQKNGQWKFFQKMKMSSNEAKSSGSIFTNIPENSELPSEHLKTPDSVVSPLAVTKAEEKFAESPTPNTPELEEFKEMFEWEAERLSIASSIQGKNAPSLRDSDAMRKKIGIFTGASPKSKSGTFDTVISQSAEVLPDEKSSTIKKSRLSGDSYSESMTDIRKMTIHSKKSSMRMAKIQANGSLTCALNGSDAQEYSAQLEVNYLVLYKKNPAQVVDKILLLSAFAQPLFGFDSKPGFTVYTPQNKQLFFSTNTSDEAVNWVSAINSISVQFSASMAPLTLEENQAIEVTDLIFEVDYAFLNGVIVETLGQLPHEPMQWDETVESKPPKPSKHPQTAVKFKNEILGPTSPIAGITAEALVDRLCGRSRFDISWIVENSLGLLSNRLVVSYSPDDPMFKWRAVIRLRTIIFVFIWMRIAWNPDFLDASNRAALHDFIKLSVNYFGPGEENNQLNKYKAHFCKIAGLMNATAIKREAVFAEMNMLPSLPSPVKDNKKEVPIIDRDPFMIAAALFLKDYEQAQKIKPVHLLVRLWQKETDPVVAQFITPVTNFIDSFNTTCFWVATQICTQPELGPRVKVVEKFIKIAKECRKLNHFNAVMAIVSGLNLVSVGRLKQTWDAVDSKSMKNLRALEDFLSPASNYKIYRHTIEEMDPNICKIPVLSLLIKDMFFTSDANPKYLVGEPEDKLISISKMELLCEMAVNFCRMSSIPLPPLPAFDEDDKFLVNHMRALKEAALYKYSTLCQPKTGDEEANLRQKWMNEAQKH